MRTWVIGSGGLLGSALRRRSTSSFDSSPVPWSDPTNAAAVLREDAAKFLDRASGDPWSIVWAAGAATTASSQAAARSELGPLEAVLDLVRQHPHANTGAFFLTSSAGGIYAGSVDPPFGVQTEPAPLSPYGELKLAQEQLCRDRLEGVSSLLIGRVSNLYGPGQNLSKLQGLISRLALAAVTRQPINIFVPLDTIRDYIYADDAAACILDITHEAASEACVTSALHIVASGQGTTVGYLLQTMNHITKRQIPVAFGSHSSATAQSLDLRLEPTIYPRGNMPLPAGMKLVYQDILEGLQKSHVH